MFEFLTDDAAQGMTEYFLLFLGIIVVVAAVVKLLGVKILSKGSEAQQGW